MNKILHILSLKRRAGVEVMFLNYLRIMKEKDLSMFKEQIVYAINLSDGIERELKDIGVKYFYTRNKKILNMDAIIQLKKIVSNYKVNTVYTQNFIGNLYGSLLCSVTKNVKLICHEHGGSWNAVGLKYIINRYIMKKATKIICNSKASQILLHKRFKVPCSNTEVVYNGVPYNKNINSIKDGNSLLYVGRLDFVKSTETLIQAMVYVLNEFPSQHLAILGEGELENKLKVMAKNYNIQNSVSFKGNVTNVGEYMSSSALLLLPSIRESLGNVIIEAAQHNTASIASNIDGLGEVIDNKRTGILIDPTIDIVHKKAPKFVVQPTTGELVKPKRLDPQILGETICKVLRDKSYIKIGENASGFVQHRFNINRYYEEVTSILWSKGETHE